MTETFSVDSYFTEHLRFDPRREVAWREIVAYLAPYLPQGADVLELAAGHCHFINNVPARRRVALDISDIVTAHAAKGVESHVGSADDLSFLANDSFDAVLASNFFEHIDDSTFRRVIAEVRRVLRPGGRLIIIQPNFRYSYRDYYDDYTHVRAFNDIGLAEELRTLGFTIERLEPRFIPFSLAKARFSTPAWLVRLYLRLPWRPKAGQMLVIARSK